MTGRPLTRAQYKKALQQCFDESYRAYPEEWARTFEQGAYRPRWYTRLWRRLFPRPATICGLGKAPTS